MRPVNLIPPEERRDKGQVRTGPIAYLLVGSLAVALAAVTLLVLTSNKVSDRKAQIADLQQQQAAAQQRATELAPFAQFATVEQQRTATIKSLANSRFDWERVMRELALVIPGDVWLTDLSGTVGGDASTTSTDTGSASATVTGVPSLTLKGCASGQDAVAGFLSALRDIDGVTRVGLSKSERPSGTTTGSSTEGGASGGDCRTRDFITQFEIVAAFDAVPTPPVPGATPAPGAPTTPAPASTPETTPASDTTATSGGS